MKQRKSHLFPSGLTLLLSVASLLFIESSNLLPSAYLLYFLAGLLAAVLVCLPKQRGRALHFFALFLAVFDTLLLVALANSNRFIQLLLRLPGSMNTEATLFSLAALLSCGLGVQIGLELGALLSGKLGAEKRRNPHA